MIRVNRSMLNRFDSIHGAIVGTMLLLVLGCDHAEPPPPPPGASTRVVFVLTDDLPGIELTNAQRMAFLEILSNIDPIVPEAVRVAPNGRFDCAAHSYLLVGGQIMTVDRRHAWPHPAFARMDRVFRDAHADRTTETARAMLYKLNESVSTGEPTQDR